MKIAVGGKKKEGRENEGKLLYYSQILSALSLFLFSPCVPHNVFDAFIQLYFIFESV